MIQLLDSVSAALYDKFGPDIEIYRDAVTMGTTTPCFFIKVLEPSIQPEANRLWTLIIPLDVHYFPADDRDTTGMHRTALDMLSVLKMLPDVGEGRPYVGTSISWEIQSGVLHFFTTYKLRFRDVEEKYLMEILQTELKPYGNKN